MLLWGQCSLSSNENLMRLFRIKKQVMKVFEKFSTFQGHVSSFIPFLWRRFSHRLMKRNLVIKSQMPFAVTIRHTKNYSKKKSNAHDGGKHFFLKIFKFARLTSCCIVGKAWEFPWYWKMFQIDRLVLNILHDICLSF